jgi:hypothetical protein
VSPLPEIPESVKDAVESFGEECAASDYGEPAYVKARQAARVVLEQAIREWGASLQQRAKQEPTLGEEHYWCGCKRFARWQRCERHQALEHDEEPMTRREEEARASLGEPAPHHPAPKGDAP